MKEVSIIAVDLAKQAFQVHGAAAEGSVVFRKKLSRSQFLAFMSRQPACLVAMEACATSHYWGREIMKLGHTVRLIPPIYVKPFVKRHKNDAADAEAIAEAASRPTMRFVAVKSEEQQARAMIFRARDLLVRQRTQLINALRGHLAEFGIVVAKGPVHLEKLNDTIDELETGLPPMVREIGRTYLDQIAVYTEEIADLEKKLHAEAAGGEVTKRLQTMPGIGRSRPWLSKRLPRRWKAFDAVATSPPGSGLCLCRSQPAASRSMARPRRWVSATSADC
ncbi:transposase [Mesorhizobium japonicum MAFF 303099]|uniref:Transposase n=1 Tax=Mesorhizobium japonicum (strain LMG 29417 / CECT 9101 / MAFF 303099) TaxID=266835 RepID=Q98AC0_RHILO|nr:transposase [Mesorhizobium japonicum MAFF 303099]